MRRRNQLLPTPRENAMAIVRSRSASDSTRMMRDCGLLRTIALVGLGLTVRQDDLEALRLVVAGLRELGLELRERVSILLALEHDACVLRPLVDDRDVAVANHLRHRKLFLEPLGGALAHADPHGHVPL